MEESHDDKRRDFLLVSPEVRTSQEVYQLSICPLPDRDFWTQRVCYKTTGGPGVYIRVDLK